MTAENTVNHCHRVGGSIKPPPPTELQDPGTITTLIDRHEGSIKLHKKPRESLPEMTGELIYLYGYNRSPTLQN